MTTTVAGRRQIFAHHDCAIVVLDAMRWLHASGRFVVDAAVVMPDHLHFVGQLGEGPRQVGSRLEAAPTAGSRLEAAPTAGSRLEAAPTAGSRLEAAPTLATIMHSLKSFSANRLARAGIAVPVWQKGFYDHGLREDEQYRVMVQYVLQNPVRAGLVQRVEDYPYVVFPDWWEKTAG